MAGIVISSWFFLIRWLESLFLPRFAHVGVSTNILIPLARVNQIDEGKMFESVLNRKYNSSFSAPFPIFFLFFTSFGYCFEFFCFYCSCYGDVWNFFLNFLFSIFFLRILKIRWIWFLLVLQILSSVSYPIHFLRKISLHVSSRRVNVRCKICWW